MIEIKMRKEYANLGYDYTNKFYIIDAIYKGENLAFAWFFSDDNISKSDDEYVYLAFEDDDVINVENALYNEYGNIYDIKTIKIKVKDLKDIVEVQSGVDKVALGDNFVFKLEEAYYLNDIKLIDSGRKVNISGKEYILLQGVNGKERNKVRNELELYKGKLFDICESEVIDDEF